MSRIVTVGAAQLGPVQRADSRAAVVARMLDLLRQAGEHRCDLDLGKSYKATTFNFARHRQPEQYRMIVERRGAVEPE